MTITAFGKLRAQQLAQDSDCNGDVPCGAAVGTSLNFNVGTDRDESPSWQLCGLGHFTHFPDLVSSL